MDWMVIFSTKQEYKAILVKGMLEENGIDAVVLNNQDSMYQFGEIKVLVRSQDVIEAKQLIIKHEDDK